MSFQHPAHLPPSPNAPSPAAPTQPMPQSKPWAGSDTVPVSKPAPATTPVFPPKPPSFGSGFSASTEEILRRVSANASAHAGTPGWEAAREQVLKSMVTSDKIPTPPPMSSAVRKGRSTKPAMSGTPRAESVTAAGEHSATPASANSAASTRGRGGARGRGRGGVKGGKRKRAVTPDSEDDSDISSSYTPLPTKTKSGRNVTKPTQFTPVLPSPSTGPKKKRAQRRAAETTVCKVCQRGHSPASNMIVFCDGCNSGYHQYCHDPPIDREVIQVAEKEWFCSNCMISRTKQDHAIPSVSELVAGNGLSAAEKRAYFGTLSSSKLTELLMHAVNIHPDLPVFAPNARSIIPADVVARLSNADASQSNFTSTIADTMSHSNHSIALPQNDSAIRSLPDTHTTVNTQLSTAPAQPTMVEPEPENDPYGDGYDSDPPAHYPRPGNGLARTLRPESEDLQWLVDDNLEVFSHVYTSDGQTLNGFAADGSMDLTGAGAVAGS
ncbi:uncharacterized protein K452DRAFT_349281 [Aplosporella prunicola CBS 121167]|uniref:PHD-type domain-containing protein n=1 Tax=Aplosporella prunicola CBS 121167 TaxID=1176127 RepID=A0A6A6BLI5_9PEZI|nr:uncharacterized protein K452DRAFT_349281 [Aplosporella prunicola CBS 121167]KAF2144896.1 hypothetical protein K452DRAFT_349281 [Aplosporella prunicola CBS 121167]